MPLLTSGSETDTAERRQFVLSLDLKSLLLELLEKVKRDVCPHLSHSVCLTLCVSLFLSSQLLRVWRVKWKM